MSAPSLSTGSQLQYILQWFGEFSELQREDFLPILAATSQGKEDLLASSLAALNCQDKPMSLFQCRIKLFNEWYPTWSEDEQSRLIKGVTETDPTFGANLQDLIANGPQVNGGMNGFHVYIEENGDHETAEPAVVEEGLSNGVGEMVDNTVHVEIAAAS